MSPPAEPPADRPPADPFELWRQLYAANERAWNAALERSLASPAFAEAQGKLLETVLHLQKTAREQVRTYLEAVNVPSRQDLARLGELIVGLEEKVDQLADRLLDLETAIHQLAAAAGPGPEPPRPGGRNAARRPAPASTPATAVSPSPSAATAASPSAAPQPAEGTEQPGASRPSASRPRGRTRRTRQEP